MDARQRGGERGKKNKDGEHGGTGEDPPVATLATVERSTLVSRRTTRSSPMLGTVLVWNEVPSMRGGGRAALPRTPSVRASIEQFNYRHSRTNTSRKRAELL